ncbi:MAG: CapA family protein [Actinomycetales bacterium]|nr:CapA family protein [Actinomycetales bacterium]
MPAGVQAPRWGACLLGLTLVGGQFVCAPPVSAKATQVIEFAFAGDVHFTEQVAGLLRVPKDRRLARVRALMSAADVSMVNFESAITGRGTPAPKVYHFRAPASSLDALASAGVDVVTMANNHAVDFGKVGLADTLSAVDKHRDRGAPWVVGIGRNLGQANAPVVLRVKGQRIAVFGATDIPDWTAAHYAAGRNRGGVNSTVRSDAALVSAVKQWRSRADIVVVFMHWGMEYTKCPSRSQRTKASDLVGAGADLVIGSHPHIQQGMGMKGRALVAYSLGNFIWFWNDRLDRASTGVLHVKMRGRQVVRAWWKPTHTLNSGEPTPVTDRARIAQVARDLRQRGDCAGLKTPAGWKVG